jgi:hypothetical protein
MKFYVILTAMTEKKTLKLTPKPRANSALSLKKAPTRSGSLSLNTKAKPSGTASLSLKRKSSTRTAAASGSLSLNRNKPSGTSSLSLNKKAGSLSLKRTGSLSLKRTTTATDSDETTTGAATAPTRPMRTLRGKKRIVVNTQPKRRPKPKPRPAPKPKPKPVPKPKPKKPPLQKKKKPIPPPMVKLPPPKEEEIQQLNEALLANFEVWRLNRPLQLKVKKRLRQLVKSKTYEPLPCLHRRVVIALLKRHARSEIYLNNVIEGEHRYSLDNEIVGEILEEEREFSREKLADHKIAKEQGISLQALEDLREEKEKQEKKEKRAKELALELEAENAATDTSQQDDKTVEKPK